MQDPFLNIFPFLVEEEFQENPKIFEFPNGFLNSERLKERMYLYI